MIDIFNNLSVLGKSLIIILIIMFIVLAILIIYLCVRKKQENTLMLDTDFFDELKNQSENIKSTFIDNVDIDKVNDIAKKVEVKNDSLIKHETNNNEKFDIGKAAKQMEEDIENSNIDLTEYEVEQEEKAIISYTELLKKVKQNSCECKVNVQTVDLNSKTQQLNDEFNFNTEVLDFSDLSDTAEKKEGTSTLFKQDDIKEMLNIKNVDTALYSSDEFLNALKELRDSLD